MRNQHIIYQQLNSSLSASRKERLLVDYLQASTSRLPNSQAERAALAYEIAGLLSTRYAASLLEGSPLEEVLALAGELEVPDEDNARKWMTLRRMVTDLSGALD